MVAKRADSPYVGGRTRAWLKVKTLAGREEMRGAQYLIHTTGRYDFGVFAYAERLGNAARRNVMNWNAES